MGWLKRMAAVARLDLVEVFHSRWLVFHSVLYAVLAGLFLFVGLRESSVLGFTGMSRLLLSLCNALVLILPLLALTASGLVVNRHREDGTLELLFSLPVSRGEYFTAVSVVRFLVLLLPLLLLVPTLGVADRLLFGQSVPWQFIGRSLAISATLLWSFVGLGLAVSTLVRNRTKALMYLLLIWIVCVGGLDFALMGLMLQWRLNAETVFVLSGLNPVQCSRLALLSTAEPSLGILGPVGFYLANCVGVAWLFLLGTLQPALVGGVAWYVAWRHFRCGDLV
ncbi:MAG: ABC transporter permease [Gemmataceae bacterium]